MERSEVGKAQAENVQLRKLSRAGSSTSNVQRSTVKRSAQEILAILHKWGIHTLGQLAALDKEQLGARLGPEAVRMWERANGQSNRVLKLVRPPESFAESFEFENEIETAEPLLFMLRRFLEQLAIRLGTIYLVAKELALRITFTDKQIYERVFKIPQPTNDADLLFRMLHTHLENFKSEHAIVAVSLEAHPTKPVREQFGLFETTLRNPHQLSETLARLIAVAGCGPSWHASFRRDASAGCISSAALHVGYRVRCPQRRIFPCAEDSARYSSAAKISSRSVRISFVGCRHTGALSQQHRNFRESHRATRAVFDFWKLVGREILGSCRMGSPDGKWRTDSCSRKRGNLGNGRHL